MSPLRFVVLALLIYVGYRLLIGSRRNKQHKGDGRRADGEAAVSDVLVEDPVCRTLIPKGQAIRLQHEGKIVFFCSEKCCDEFINKRKEE